MGILDQAKALVTGRGIESPALFEARESVVEPLRRIVDPEGRDDLMQTRVEWLLGKGGMPDAVQPFMRDRAALRDDPSEAFSGTAVLKAIHGDESMWGSTDLLVTLGIEGREVPASIRIEVGDNPRHVVAELDDVVHSGRAFPVSGRMVDFPTSHGQVSELQVDSLVLHRDFALGLEGRRLQDRRQRDVVVGAFPPGAVRELPEGWRADLVKGPVVPHSPDLSARAWSDYRSRMGR